MGKLVKNNVFWVGKVDWELRKFHGVEYSTHLGSTYNSYLIRDAKTALIDTVWQPYAKEFVQNLQDCLPLQQIDFVIASHAEIDHSGALPDLLELIPDVPVYCSANGMKSLKGHYHKNWNFKPVTTGTRLSLGEKELIFIEAPMLHWPDSLMSYLTGDNILFSNDSFGQHYATEKLFNDLVDQPELMTECLKYYANILQPFSPLVEKKIQEILGLGLPLDMICTSHGIVWRQNPSQIIEKYQAWAGGYQENQVTIIYDTMWGGTRVMAERIAEGLQKRSGDTMVKLYNMGNSDKNDVIAEIFKSKAVLLGSPTINNGILSSLAGLLEEMRGLKFRNKKAATFGCFGWSGESSKILAEQLNGAGFQVVDDGLRVIWNPDKESIETCISFGEKLAGLLT